MYQSDLAARIRYAMKKLNMTQQEFAQILGVTQPAVSNYLKGRIPPGPVLLRIARVASVSVEWLLSGENKPDPRAVAEPGSKYTTGRHLAEKIARLSPSVQRTLSVLIDHLLQIEETKSADS